jgi:putative heme-binding domain-containing protein
MTLPLRVSLLAAVAACAVFGSPLSAAAAGKCSELFSRDNLVAWCIVPFDSGKRSPEERAAMLKRLGFRRFAYDWRAEHLPTFERELAALESQGISLDAVWFPAALNDEAKALLDGLQRHKIRTQLWVTMGDPAPQGDQAAKVAAAVATIRPIAQEAEKLGCQVALYNHGGWFGEPENQLAVIDKLGMSNAGIVYNLHHGHDHLDRFEALLKEMLPHLLALNLNGMSREGDRMGKKILPLGEGEVDLALLRTICASGYHGPIGILGHTMDDAEQRLLDNLEGLDWLVARLEGKATGPKPTPRTPVGEGPPQPAGQFRGRIADGRPEYRQPPLTVECRAKLTAHDNYNILVANDTKQSGAHWEIFSMAGAGTLTAYLPGMKPDHVRSQKFLCDGMWHDLAVLFEPGRVRLLADGELVADEPVEHTGQATLPGGLAIGRLVEGGIGCDGELAYVRLTSGLRENVHRGATPPSADENTIGLWVLDDAARGNVEDQSKLKNTAKLAGAPPAAQGIIPTSGVNFNAVDPSVQVDLIDRSRNDAYLGVKVDSEGRVFVGAREAVYLFEPDEAGGYKLRQEVCRLPADSIVMGLEFRGDDLYVLTDNALYHLPRGRIERHIKPQRILWGLPLDLHVSFHCLAWGPEGDLYLTHGDPLLNYGDWSRPDHWGHWTLYAGPDAKEVSYTGAGALLRVRPDGSDVRVVATGLRGPVGLAFDPQWNLFTNDNDHESRADLYAPARLLHVTPHVDFAWPRGWIASKSPRRFDLVEPLTAALGRGVPCDLVWFDGESDRPRALLMARWDQMTVNRCPLARRGASFETKEESFVEGRDFARPVGIAAGPDGRLFVTSLYLGGNVGSPHCYSDLVMLSAPAARRGDLQPYDAVAAPAAKLWRELSHASWHRRMTAHQDILRRGGKLLDEAVAVWQKTPDGDPALGHLPWLAAAGGSSRARQMLIDLAGDREAEMRLLGIRVLAEFRNLDAPLAVFTAALGDSDTRVQLAALGALFDRDEPFPVDAVARLATSDDTYLRQTASKLLAQRAPADDLARLAKSSDAATRRAAVLAAGFRLTVPPPGFSPPESLPLSYDAGNASFTLTFADAADPVDLRALRRVGSFTTAQWWKSVPATPQRQQLFDLLVGSLADSSGVAEQAAYFLSLLRDPRSEPLIDAMHQRLLVEEARKFDPRTVEHVWSLESTDASFALEAVAPPDRAPIDLAATYVASPNKITWTQRDSQEGRFSYQRQPGRAKRVYAYFQLQTASRQPAMVEVAGCDRVGVWHNGRAVALSDAGAALDLQPGSNDLLLRLDGPADGVGMSFRAAPAVAASVPERTDASLAERLRQSGQGGDQVPAELLAVDWTAPGEGDVHQGRKLFGSLGCTKCHGITLEDAGGGAPNLADLRRRFTKAYVVESVLLPSKQVADPFRGTTLALADGRTLTGLVVNDTDQQLDLLLPDARRVAVAKADIEERSASPISPMPAGLVKTEQELRDLLAYLFSERPTPP